MNELTVKYLKERRSPLQDARLPKKKHKLPEQIAQHYKWLKMERKKSQDRDRKTAKRTARLTNLIKVLSKENLSLKQELQEIHSTSLEGNSNSNPSRKKFFSGQIRMEKCKPNGRRDIQSSIKIWHWHFIIVPLRRIVSLERYFVCHQLALCNVGYQTYTFPQDLMKLFILHMMIMTIQTAMLAVKARMIADILPITNSSACSDCIAIFINKLFNVLINAYIKGAKDKMYSTKVTQALKRNQKAKKITHE
ncbi:unnamed protein product [Rotaria socialis]|uniref:Uncharacterized protein n=1 Tax=Rotaria socialis TaxID=392032 RepID=A0A821TVZ4_9BILA|nr:unnamed protein product [Rotaria socialis]